jgi:LmbE family N-acetylglucosaminyl deacetylase
VNHIEIKEVLQMTAPHRNTELIYQLQRLGMAGSVLHIGAHPDDEDAGMMAYIARKVKARVVYWSATRGEGGQNRINAYQKEALGVYRTWESQAARAVDGGECLFGPFLDFGFSKSGEETLSKWGRTEVLREIVRAIRLVQPQIVISRWSGTPNDGHGHHQAIGLMTSEAFEAAGDAGRFPELQAQGLAPWQARKLYDSTVGDWQPGEDCALGKRIPDFEQDGFVCINTGAFDPIAGMTFQEQAWTAFNSHKTQAIGFIPEKGDYYCYYSLQKSLVPVPERETGLYDGLDPSLAGLADYPGGNSASLREKLAQVKSKAESALAQFHADDPAKAADMLLEGLFLLRRLRAGLNDEGLNDASRQALDLYAVRKIDDFEAVTAQCLGLQLECFTDDARITPGQQFRVTARLWNQRGIQIDRADFTPDVPDGWQVQSADTEPSVKQPRIAYDIISPETADLTCPYWLRESHSPHRYNFPDGEPSGRPFEPPLVGMTCKISLGRHQLTLREPAVLREAFTGGYRELPMAVIPPISLHPRNKKQILQVKPAAQQFDLQVVARNNMEHTGIDGKLRLEVPPGWRAEPGQADISLEKKDDTKTVQFTVSIPENTEAGLYPLQYIVHCRNRDFGVILEPVRMGAPGLPQLPDESTCVKEEFVTTPAVVNAHLIDVEFIQGLNYAYITGIAEEVTESLASFGIPFHMISDEDMGFIDLSRFDAVVVGPNAYLVRDELRKNKARFLEYVGQGGTLIVQYHGYGYQSQGFAPYPFSYSQPHDRVTDEYAPVTFLKPDHPLLNRPNIITETDFEGWVHDRGMYFFGRWAEAYEPVLACNDLGEAPKHGGFLMAAYGKGTYVYTGYSFHRQLPAAVPGGFRIFANLLALPLAKTLARADILRKSSLFSFMDEDQLQEVARIVDERWEKDGVWLCRQGDKGDEMYVIARGEVEAVRTVDGREQVIYLAKAGEVIGEMNVLGRMPRSAAMRTRGKTHLLVIAGDRFQDLMHKEPGISDQVIKILVSKLTGAAG